MSRILAMRIFCGQGRGRVGKGKAPAKLARSAGASPAQVRPSKPPGSECCVRRRRRRTRSVHSGCVGCVIEPRNDEFARAETVFMVERNMCDAVMRGIAVPPGSKSTSRAKGSRRNLGYPTSGRRLRVRSRVRRSASGRRGAVADDARAWEVGRGHSSCEAGEQGRAICCGVGGAKGRGQGECAPSKHAPEELDSHLAETDIARSEERRVGKECR